MSDETSGWIDACASDDIAKESVVRFDHDERTFALYRSPAGGYYCTDGLCPRERAHLADGRVSDHAIECPGHDGRFDYRTGEPLREADGEPLAIYPTRVAGDRLLVQIDPEADAAAS